MLIPVYAQEIKDGLGEKVREAIRATMFSPLTPSLLKTPVDEKIIARITANFEKQPDLFYMNNIMTRTGWNDNDDVFIASECWKARKTCTDKPLNIEHDDKQIIGHITNQVVITADRKSVIEDSTPADEIPQEFDILNSDVIYLKCWQDEEYEKKIKAITDEITSEDNPWGVSLEVLAADFAYAIKEKNGDEHILARNNKTAFLTKYLRCYGGTGEYDGCRVGRAPLGFIFSAKGITKNPANKHSEINPKTNISVFGNISKFVCSKYSDSYKFSSEIEMDELKKQVDELNTKLKASTDSNETLVNESKSLKSEVEKLNSTVAEKDKIVAELTAKCDEANKELNKINKEKEKVERVSAVVETLGVEKEQAEKIYEGILKNMTSEAFKAYLEFTPKVVKTEPIKTTATEVLETAVPEKTNVTPPVAGETNKVGTEMADYIKASLNKTNNTK